MADQDRRGGTLESLRVHMFLATLSTGFVLTLLLCGALFVPLFLRLGTGDQITEEVLRVSERLLFLHEHFWPLAFVCLAAPCFSTYFLYRRMTQPLVRFRRMYKALAEGQIPNAIGLRASDYLKHDADLLNDTLSALRARSHAAASARKALDDEVQELLECARDGSNDIESHIHRFAERHKLLRGELQVLAPTP